MLITAHFKTLTKAIAEARKYGVQPNYDTIVQQLRRGEASVMAITVDRKLTFERLPHARKRRIKLTIDVIGRVVPVQRVPKYIMPCLVY